MPVYYRRLPINCGYRKLPRPGKYGKIREITGSSLGKKVFGGCIYGNFTVMCGKTW